MIFETEMISFNILDVIKLSQENVTSYNSQRNFSAVSFRLHADTVLKTKVQKYHLTDNYISYVPSRLDYSRISKKDELIAIHFDSTNYSSKNIEIFLPENPETFKALFEKILDCWNKKETSYKYKCSAIFYEILALCHSENSNKQPTFSKIQTSVNYILNNYNNPNLKISEIASKSFISEVYFRRKFKKSFGITPKQYILDIRVKKAKQLLSSDQFSVTEIAEQCGFSSVYHFCRIFKQKTSFTPTEYILKNRIYEI